MLLEPAVSEMEVHNYSCKMLQDLCLMLSIFVGFLNHLALSSSYYAYPDVGPIRGQASTKGLKEISYVSSLYLNPYHAFQPHFFPYRSEAYECYGSVACSCIHILGSLLFLSFLSKHDVSV